MNAISTISQTRLFGIRVVATVLLLVVSAACLYFLGWSDHYPSIFPRYFSAAPDSLEIDQIDFIAGLSMDDPRMIAFIRRHYVVAPSKLPYNLVNPEQPHYGQYPEVEASAVRMFKNKSNGVFFEGGAYDGESLSNSLYFEKTLGWKVLLVEPFPPNIRSILSKNRKATLVTSCLSGPVPEQLILDCFDKNSFWGCQVKPIGPITSAQIGHVTTTPDPIRGTRIWCFPLYSVLLATGFTEIDYMVLDIESHEATVLDAMPFDKLKIKVIQIEVGGVDPKTDRHGQIRAVFRRWPQYKEYKLFPIDIVFVNTQLISV